MYASLCRTLCEHAPNFDPPPANTFRRLLLAKCQDEFDNRKKALHEAPPNSEQRTIAKQKMLGNMRLIGELGKQCLLHEKILHECLQSLLKGKKQEDVDLECLCHMVRTVGARLDTSKGRALVDQYFERMVKLYSQEGIPARIKFMLQDVCELRKNDWQPRRRAAVGNLQQPTTLATIRSQVIPPMPRHSGQMMNGNNLRHQDHSGHHQDMHLGRGGNNGINRRENNGSFNDDMFFNPLSSMKKNHGSSSPNSNDFCDFFESKTPSIMSNGHRDGNVGGGGRHHHHNNHHHQNRNFMNGHRDSNNHYNQRNNGNHNNSSQGIQNPLRLLKNSFPQQLDELSLRPHAAPPSVLKPKAMPVPGAQLPQNNFARNNCQPQQSILQAVSVKPTVSTSMPIKTEPKPKTTTKAEYQEKVKQLLEQNCKKPLKETEDKSASENEVKEENGTTLDTDQICSEIAKLEIPKKFMNDILVSVSLDALKKDSGPLDTVEELLTRFATNGVADTLSNVLRKLSASTELLIAQRAAELTSRLIVRESLEFADVCQWTELPSGEENCPWILSVLQLLLKEDGEEKLVKRCKSTNLLPHLLPAQRNKEGLANVLDQNGLNCLQPLNMRLDKQLAQCLPSLEAVQRFVESLEEETKLSSDFVLALVTAIMRFNYNEASKEAEQTALKPFTGLLKKYCAARNGMWALYAVQELWAKKGYPKDILLRWFEFFYYADVVEDSEFSRWKEDVTVDIAGKGKGLFEVNSWLNWIEEAEDDEEDGADD